MATEPADPSSSGRRRRQIISAAADLLREEGPEALTSVAVAQRVGIAQSAVYRYVRTIDELRRLATEEIVDDLRQALGGIVVSPELRELVDIEAAFTMVIDAMDRFCLAYDTIDRWQFDDGDLGTGVREVCAEFDDVIAGLLEHHYRSDFGITTAWTDEQRSAQLLHARLFQRDGVAVARLLRSGAPRDELARILRYRTLWSWVAYVLDMHDRLRLPRPDVDVDDLLG
jgi:AcrR family transcriptional regulator